LARGAILWGKTQAILVRTLAGWLAYLVCVVAWIGAVGASSPQSITYEPVGILLYIPAYVVFLIGTGLYAGLRLRTPFSAVLVTLAVVFAHRYISRELFSLVFDVASRLRIDPALAYYSLEITVQAIAGVTLWLLALRSLRRHVF
jgi:hypothetical protein